MIFHVLNAIGELLEFRHHFVDRLELEVLAREAAAEVDVDPELNETDGVPYNDSTFNDVTTVPIDSPSGSPSSEPTSLPSAIPSVSSFEEGMEDVTED
ncbi:MAG: hypothetical protein AAGB34_09470, partial [Planctomycetota bacterium]